MNPHSPHSVATVRLVAARQAREERVTDGLRTQAALRQTSATGWRMEGEKWLCWPPGPAGESARPSNRCLGSGAAAVLAVQDRTRTQALAGCRGHSSAPRACQQRCRTGRLRSTTHSPAPGVAASPPSTVHACCSLPPPLLANDPSPRCCRLSAAAAPLSSSTALDRELAIAACTSNEHPHFCCLPRCPPHFCCRQAWDHICAVIATQRADCFRRCMFVDRTSRPWHRARSTIILSSA